MARARRSPRLCSARFAIWCPTVANCLDSYPPIASDERALAPVPNAIRVR
jgi:hypothetical protein